MAFSYNDVGRGGVGNDTVVGGEGADSFFGNDDLDHARTLDESVAVLAFRGW
jgi:Ca2+-binding RTX toxin-like protein